MPATPTIPAEADMRDYPAADLHAATVHLEDLEIFVGQRSRMHPGPGWAVALGMIRRDLAAVRAELAIRAEQFAADGTPGIKPHAIVAGPGR